MDKQPEIIAFESDLFGPYPFSAAGGIVHDGAVGFALETQTRPIYSPFFFGPEGNDFVVVHELAHQWYGNSLAVDSWNETWLNEGFATYAEWLWGAHEDLFTPREVFDFFATLPADDPFWELPIGDPGIDSMFDGRVYARGALTLQALRMEVGRRTFFRILRTWAATQAGGTVTTREFIDLAETISGRDLDPLFAEWLSAGKPASLDAGTAPSTRVAGRAPFPMTSVATKLHAIHKAAIKEGLALRRGAGD